VVLELTSQFCSQQIDDAIAAPSPTDRVTADQLGPGLVASIRQTIQDSEMGHAVAYRDGGPLPISYPDFLNECVALDFLAALHGIQAILGGHPRFAMAAERATWGCVRSRISPARRGLPRPEFFAERVDLYQANIRNGEQEGSLLRIAWSFADLAFRRTIETEPSEGERKVANFGLFAYTRGMGGAITGARMVGLP
jgi:hypothetical protein